MKSSNGLLGVQMQGKKGVVVVWQKGARKRALGS